MNEPTVVQVEPSSGDEKGRLKRWLWIAVLAYLVIYVGGANFVLNTDVVKSAISRKPEKMLVEWESGWTVLPGFVHIEGLRIRGQTKTQQWQCRLAEADVRISLLRLINRTVRVSRADGSTFSFRLRPRLTEETKDSPVAQHHPEIEGFSNPPDPAPEDIYPPKKKKKKRGWIIDLSDIVIEGDTELWIGRLRIAGTGTVDGGFDFQLRSDMAVPDAMFNLQDGSITADGKVFVEKLGITADVSLTPFIPKETKGTAIFDHLLGSFQLRNGEIPDLSLVNLFLPPLSALSLVSGVASFNWDFDKPSIEAGSSGDLEVSVDGADMLIGENSISGDFDLDGHLLRGSLTEGSWKFGETTFALENVRSNLIREPEPDADGADAEPWWARMTIVSGDIDIGQPSDIFAVFTFSMKNTDPLLELFFTKTDEETGETKLPTWVKILPDVADLEGRGSLSLDENGTIVDDVVIDGEDFDLLARLKGQEKKIDGQVYVRYKRFDLGLEMEEGKSDLKILHPKQWFLEQVEYDDGHVLQLAAEEVLAEDDTN